MLSLYLQVVLARTMERLTGGGVLVVPWRKRHVRFYFLLYKVLDGAVMMVPENLLACNK
jgi:hypothetical protein